MATRQPFRKWGHWKWIGSYPYTYVFCHWSLELIFKARLKLVWKPKNSNMAARRPFWKWHHWKSIGSYPYIQLLCHLSLELIFKARLKLESGNQKIQYGCLAAILKLTLLKINRLLHICISILCYLSLELIIKAKLKLESGNQKIQYGHQAAILKVTSLKINRLLPMTTINMHMKFEIEILKQTWLTLWKPCHLQSPETEKSNMAARRPFWK